jgi:hypothetical protein
MRRRLDLKIAGISELKTPANKQKDGSGSSAGASMWDKMDFLSALVRVARNSADKVCIHVYVHVCMHVYMHILMYMYACINV